MTPAGFPHSDILGSTSARDSPGLNAACHVLHRLLAPRHPPRALCSLTSTQHLTRRSVSGCGRSGSPKITANTDLSSVSLLPFIYPVVKVRRRGGSGPARPVRQRVRWSVGSQMSTRIRGSWVRTRSRTLGLHIRLEGGLSLGLDQRRGGGDEETRTPDPLLAKEMLCQLSYVPSEIRWTEGGGRTWTRTRDLGLIRAAL